MGLTAGERGGGGSVDGPSDDEVLGGGDSIESRGAGSGVAMGDIVLI